MNVITLAAPACLLWMALVIYRGEPWAIGHPSFASVLVAVCARLRPLHLCLAFVLFACLFFCQGAGGRKTAERNDEQREEVEACKYYKLGACTKALGQSARRVYLHKAVIKKKASTQKNTSILPFSLGKQKAATAGRTSRDSTRMTRRQHKGSSPLFKWLDLFDVVPLFWTGEGVSKREGRRVERNQV